MKLKYIIPVFIIFVSYLSCNNDDNPADNFDAAAQAVIDNETLIEYLKIIHYIPAAENEVFGSLDTIMNNEASIYDGLGDDLKIQEITEDGIDYKLYYLMLNEGVKDNPTRYDSVFVKYRGFLLDSTKFDESISFNNTSAWFDLINTIKGWKYGFPNYKSGKNVSQTGEPISFEDTGKGIIFIPSGLAYGNEGINPDFEDAFENEILLFHLELAQVVRSDHDNDGILTIHEDLNNDGELDIENDDTDGNAVPDYFDSDDDGDGVETRDELDFNEYVIDIGEDDPVFASNEIVIDRVEDIDANTITISTVILLDSNNDGTPDYLDPDTN